MKDRQSVDLNRIFTYHPPTPEQARKYVAIREAAHDFAAMIMDYCPDSRERSVAVTRIQESVMWANAAIAINESKPQDKE